MACNTNSKSKWKEVLGFDDGPLPINRSRVRKKPQNFYQIPTPTQPSYPRFPRNITFFRRGGDMVITASPPSSFFETLSLPSAQFYVTLSKNPGQIGVRGPPEIILHSGPNEASTVVSFAKFVSPSTVTDITICPPPRRSISANFSTENVALSKTVPASSISRNPVTSGRFEKKRFKYERLTLTGSLLSPEKYFFYTDAETSVREKFEWKRTPGSYSGTHCDNESRGMKLIRASTNDVLAVYATLGPSNWGNSNHVEGMFRFLVGDGELNEDFEILAVMSIVSIVEREKREWAIYENTE